MTSDDSRMTDPVRLVLCDDVPELRELLRTELENEDSVTIVGEASDGVEVVELAKRLRPELVVLNLVMPRRDGLEALPLLRALDAPPEVLVVSGYDADRMAERTRSLGAAGYIQKGGRPAHIRDAVLSLAADVRS